MAIERFPPVEQADQYGLLAVGGDLEVESLLLAYRSGIFPWPILGEDPLAWFAPPQRAVLFLSEFRLGRSFKKYAKRANWCITVDRCFDKVIKECAVSDKRQEGDGTWITRQMQKAYAALHRAGYAHSVECWRQERLVGGLYGVSIGAMFAGESMFYLEPNASKQCLSSLVELLQSHGVAWLDCQVMNPFFESVGAREIPREEFMRMLQAAVGRKEEIFEGKSGGALLPAN